MQQRTGTTKPKSTPPPSRPARVFDASADPFHVQQHLPAIKTPLKPATAPFKRGSKPFKAREALDAVKTELDKREASRMANVVGAQHGTLPGSPFGHASGPGQARDRFTPALTARADVAAANHARLVQGGILTPAQRGREAAALRVVEVSPTFHDTHGLPASVAAIGGNLKGRTPQGRPEPPPKPPHAVGARSSQPLNPFRPKPGGGDPLDFLSRAAGTALEGAAAIPGTLTTPIRPGATHTPIEDVHPVHLSTAVQDTTTRLNDVTAKAADAIGAGGGLSVPEGSIPTNWLDETSQAAVKPGTKQVPIASIGGAYLSPAQKAVEDAKAVKRGWYPSELEGLNGLETLKRSHSDPPGIVTRVLRNAAADVVRTGGVPSALYGIGREAVTGHGRRALGQLATIAGDQTIGLLTHPVEGAVSHPINFVPAAGLAGRAAGSVGLLNRGAMGARLIETGLTKDVAANSAEAIAAREAGHAVPQEPIVVHRGTYNRNLFTQSGQRVSDKFAGTRLGRRTVLKSSVDRTVRSAQNAEGAAHAVLQHAYSQIHRKIGRKRSEVLLALADSGGRPDVVLRHYEARAAIDGPQSAAAGQAAYIRDHVLGHQLNENDQLFLDVHKNLSELTSNANVEEGRFGTDAQQYRRHEALIRSAAARDDGSAESVRAKKILDLRQKLGIEKRGKTTGPAGVSELRTGKIAEAEATVEKIAKQHDKELERAAEEKPKQPAAGSGAAAQEAWRKSRNAWDRRTQRARDRAATLATQRTAAENRVGTLRAAEMDQSVKPEVHDALHGEYARQLDEFAAHHLTSDGAFTPHYVERIKVTDAGARPGWRENRARLRFSNRVSKQPASTGETFNAGDYLIDSHAPVRNSMAAMRMGATRAAYNSIIHNYGTRHGANELVPEGEVSVNENTLTTLGHALRALEENPVSHQDYYQAESDIRGKLESIIHGGSVAERGTTQGPGYFLPKDVFDRMIDYVRPESRNAYDRFLRQYQRALISIYPSTVLGNTVGSLPLAAAAGAWRPHTWSDAARAMRNPELGPLAMRGKGAAAGLASDPHNPVGRWMDFMRRQSVKGEDYSRLAAFFSKASPYIRKRADELNVDVDEYLKKFVKGEIDEHKLSEFLDHAEKFLGDTVKPNTKFGRSAGHLILFHNWVGHMMKVMLYTLPVQHPGRAAIINILGMYGDQYRMEHGVWPQWMVDFLPLIHFTRMLPGAYGPQNMTLSADATQFTPQGTAGGLLGQLSQDRPFLDNAASVIAPPWSALLKWGLIQRDAANAQPTDLNVPDPTRAFVSQLLGMIPGERKFFPTTGQREDSLPWAPQPRMYMAPHGTGRIQSPFLTPGAKPLGSRPGDSALERLVGLGSRVAGVPLWTSATEGKVTKDERVKAKEANRTSGRSDKSAARRKRRLRRQYEHKLHPGG